MLRFLEKGDPMKQTKEPLKVIDPALLSKILGAVPSTQDHKGQGIVIPQSRFASFFHS
jgi:hypothetical protein